MHLDQGQVRQAVPEGSRIVSAYTDVILDTETPISAYLKLSAGREGYLLESVEGGEHVARYSFVGVDPFLMVKFNEGHTSVTELNGSTRNERTLEGSPWQVLRDLLEDLRMPGVPSIPRFSGGLVGYLSYDLVRYIERLPGGPVDDLGLPESWLMACRKIVVFDHVTRRGKIVINIPSKGSANPFREAVTEMEDTVAILGQRPPALGPESRAACMRASLRFNTSREAYVSTVNLAKEYIRSGDIFQVVLSQRAEARLSVHPLSIYRSLRAVNPSPYMFYMNFGETQMAGASPEMLVRVEGDAVKTMPIAGTRRRGDCIDEDARLAQELQDDEKERAEHVMLVDLGRNDLGRVCRYGSVRVPRFMEVERFSHVMHLVSEVTGVLRPGMDAIDALLACFPAGTLSGAPKVRAMEIIDELETCRRGPYGGAVGYLGFSGNMDTCITIRTALMHRGRVHIQAGAGIVYDSDPEREYAECMQKAEALFSALEGAEEVESQCQGY
ncbi:MAG: anthranilate synthase component I [Bacillota bacterium]